jgi:hypothetical protein
MRLFGFLLLLALVSATTVENIVTFSGGSIRCIENCDGQDEIHAITCRRAHGSGWFCRIHDQKNPRRYTLSKATVVCNPTCRVEYALHEYNPMVAVVAFFVGIVIVLYEYVRCYRRNE